MKPAHVLIFLLVLATVSADLAVYWALFGSRETDADHFNYQFFWVVLALGQLSLLALWAGLGKTPLPWRLLGLVVAAAFWAVLWAQWEDLLHHAQVTTISRLTTKYMVAFLFAAALVSAPVIVLRLAGGQIVRTDEVRSPTPPGAGLSRWQFSLGRVLSWITATALLLGFLRWTLRYDLVRKELAPLRGTRELPVLCFWVVVCAILLLIGLWAVLARRRTVLRGAIGFSLITLAACRDYRTWTGGPYWFAPFLWATLFAAASFLVLRVAGYRLTWRRPWWLTSRSPSAPTRLGDSSASLRASP